MGFFKKISFAIWMIFTVVRLGNHRKQIDRAKKINDYKDQQDGILKATIAWGGTVFQHYGAKVEVEGEKELPEGPVVFVSNHEGYGDIMAFMVAIKTKQFGFVAKEELGKIPIFGTWIKRIGSLMISRGDPRDTIKIFQKGEEMLKQGFSFVIFPEGTRAKDKGMASFKKGSLRMATKTGVPIVPVTIKGTWALFEKNGYPCSGTVKFYIHKPVSTVGLNKEQETSLTDKIENIVREKLNEWDAIDG